jgi:hypothetical protein
MKQKYIMQKYGNVQTAEQFWHMYYLLYLLIVVVCDLFFSSSPLQHDLKQSIQNWFVFMQQFKETYTHTHKHIKSKALDTNEWKK